MGPIDETKAAFKGSTSLQVLSIKWCEELTCLPEGVLQPTLVEISIDNCPKLKTLNPIDETEASFKLTSKMKFFPRLQKLYISACPKLISFPALKGSTSLQQLKIYGCEELTSLPEGVLQPTLIELDIRRCTKLKTLNPDALRSLTSLKVLWIVSCPNLGSCWEEGLFCTTSLQKLDIGGFGEQYRYFPWPSTSAPWSHFTSLEYLGLLGWPEVKSLPDQLDHLPALRRLKIREFSGLESLPECLGKLSSLQSLSIYWCPLLEKRCKKGISEDWHKIAHIPSIEIEFMTIQ